MNKSNLYDEIKHREIVPIFVHIHNMFLTENIVTFLKNTETRQGIKLNGDIRHNYFNRSMMLNYYFILKHD